MREIICRTQKEYGKAILENVHVILKDTTEQIIVRGNASVEARGNASVEAWDNAHALIIGDPAGRGISFFSNGSIKFYKDPNYEKSILENFQKENGKLILYKVVKRETLCGFGHGGIPYEIGIEIECDDFDSDPYRGCGGGLHLCLKASHTLKFGTGKILKCLADLEDVVVYPKSLEKVRCRKVIPVAEVDIHGNLINA